MGEPRKSGEIPRLRYTISRRRKSQECVEHYTCTYNYIFMYACTIRMTTKFGVLIWYTHVCTLTVPYVYNDLVHTCPRRGGERGHCGGAGEGPGATEAEREAGQPEATLVWSQLWDTSVGVANKHASLPNSYNIKVHTS